MIVKKILLLLPIYITQIKIKKKKMHFEIYKLNVLNKNTPNYLFKSNNTKYLNSKLKYKNLSKKIKANLKKQHFIFTKCFYILFKELRKLNIKSILYFILKISPYSTFNVLSFMKFYKIFSETSQILVIRFYTILLLPHNGLRPKNKQRKRRKRLFKKKYFGMNIKAYI